MGGGEGYPSLETSREVRFLQEKLGRQGEEDFRGSQEGQVETGLSQHQSPGLKGTRRQAAAGPRAPTSGTSGFRMLPSSITSG